MRVGSRREASTSTPAGAAGDAAATWPYSRIGRWLREPLLHFVLAGAALFGVYAWLYPSAYEQPDNNRIVITEDDLKQASVVWLAQGLPPPTPAQMANLIEGKVREEVLYREGLALGLDRNDTIVKRRMVQKMEFLAEDLAALGEPSRDELKAWYDANRERFAQPPRASFRHIYFSPDRRHGQARADAERALEQLAGKPAAAADGVGDPFMFQAHYPDRSFDQVAKTFGPGFARALFAQAPGGWRGPIESGLGWHLVWIDELTPQQVPAFDEIEPEVKQAWIAERRETMKREAYEAMRARYTVVLPRVSAPGGAASGAALRAASTDAPASEAK